MGTFLILKICLGAQGNWQGTKATEMDTPAANGLVAVMAVVNFYPRESNKCYMINIILFLRLKA
jgi:hypothetical protein